MNTETAEKILNAFGSNTYMYETWETDEIVDSFSNRTGGTENDFVWWLLYLENLKQERSFEYIEDPDIFDKVVNEWKRVKSAIRTRLIKLGYDPKENEEDLVLV